MDPSVVLKIFTDLCLYFAAAGLILPAGEAAPALLIIGGVGAVQALLYERGVRPLYRSLALLPMGAALCFVRSGQLAFLILPAMAYGAVLCGSGRVALSRERFLGYFKPISLFLAAAVLLLLIFSPEGRALQHALPYGIAGFLLGVMLLRTLRHARTTRRHRRFIFINLGLPLAVALLAFLLARAGAAGLLKSSLGLLYETLIMPLLMGIAYLFSGLVFLFQKLLSLLRREGVPGGDEFEARLESVEYELGVMAGQGSDLVGKILIALGILLALALLYFFFRAMLGERMERPLSDDPGTVGRAEPPAGGGGRKNPFAPRTPEEQVRRYFRRLLQQSREAGVTFLISDTSEQAARRASAVFDPAGLGELRGLYIRARYSPAGLSKEEARQAKALYEGLRKARKQAQGESGARSRRRSRSGAALRHKTMG